MTGYYGYSKSNNAIQAEQNGLRTASNLAKYLSKKYKKYKGCTAKDISDNIHPEEWHHSSSWFNKVNYYDILSLRFAFVRRNIQKSIQKRENAKTVIYKKCVVKWLEWQGTREHPKKVKKEDNNCTVEFYGKSTYKITFCDGNSIVKRKGTNGLFIYRNRNGEREYIS